MSVWISGSIINTHFTDDKLMWNGYCQWFYNFIFIKREHQTSALLWSGVKSLVCLSHVMWCAPDSLICKHFVIPPQNCCEVLVSLVSRQIEWVKSRRWRRSTRRGELSQSRIASSATNQLYVAVRFLGVSCFSIEISNWNRFWWFGVAVNKQFATQWLWQWRK